jgi:transcriptional regulator with GAF, ATPase, and Fis domain
VGGRVPQHVDVRVIAATNRDLSRAVREKAFRDDLFYRLNVFPIALPPLRDRKEDIPLLAHYLLKKYVMQIGKPVEGMSQETIERLQAYPWPGNVREMENVIERAVILADGRVLKIGAELLPVATIPPMQEPNESAESPSPSSLEGVQRRHILAVLKQTHWRIDGPDGAARILKVHPNTLRSRMKKLGISRKSRDAS